MRPKKWPVVKVKVKVKYVILQKFVLTINHEWVIGFWSYLYIW